jgi:hypothetical protein
MNRRVVRNLLIGGVALVAAAGAGYGVYQWQAARPSEGNFDKAMRALFAKGPADRLGRSTGNVVREACVTIPMHPAPDARSKSSRPLAWHMDFLVDAPASPARAQQLRQLDALAKAGLLVKEAAAIESNGEIKAVNRYSLTETGWAVSGSERGASCLVYGTPQYLGITRFAPKAVSTEAGLEVYEVHAKAGFRSVSELQPWAQDPEVMAAFPDIREYVDGKDLAVLMVRGGGNWVDYQSLLRTMRPGRADTAQLSEPEREAMARMEKEREKIIAAARELASPTVDEIKALLSARYGPGADRTWPAACLELPGNEKLPVDKSLSTYQPAHYAVAIFQNKERKSYDRVAGKTLPYLEMLERLGVVSKREELNVPGERRDKGAVFYAHVYELAPAYASHLDPEQADCFPLGEPTVEFVDVSVAEPDLSWSVNPRVSYKLRIRYPEPPTWMRDPALQAGWDELRHALERGRACDGRFEFDKAKRELMAGGGSCWWAFDSYYENF